MAEAGKSAGLPSLFMTLGRVSNLHLRQILGLLCERSLPMLRGLVILILKDGEHREESEPTAFCAFVLYAAPQPPRLQICGCCVFIHFYDR